jgi:hypothetical protein
VRESEGERERVMSEAGAVLKKNKNPNRRMWGIKELPYI